MRPIWLILNRLLPRRSRLPQSPPFLLVYLGWRHRLTHSELEFLCHPKLDTLCIRCNSTDQTRTILALPLRLCIKSTICLILLQRDLWEQHNREQLGPQIKLNSMDHSVPIFWNHFALSLLNSAGWLYRHRLRYLGYHGLQELPYEL